MAKIRANLGIAGLGDLGYQFYSGGTPIGTRVTAGITDDGDGWYSAAVSWVGDNVRWDSVTVGGQPARQYRADQSDAIVSSSETDIANLALAHLGESRIASLADDTSSARACALHYATVRDQVLRSHRWNFAQARVALTREVDAPAFGWSYQYALPDDCLRVLEVNDSEAGDWISDEYVIEGRALLTDAEAVNLVYTRQVVDVTEFDALFREALTLKLAVALTESIRGTTGKTAELAQMYESRTAPLARRVDANEGRRRKGILPMNSMAIRARGGV